MIYLFIIAVVLPLGINITLYIAIFMRARRSSRRLQPQDTNEHAVTNTSSRQQQQRQQPKISRRDISLLKNMLFIFAMFIVGWTPIFLLNIISFLNSVNFVVVMSCVYLSAACTLGIIVHLFLCNHEIRNYLFDFIRNLF